MELELIVNDPKTGWSNADSLTVISIDEARKFVSSLLTKNKKLQFSIVYKKKTFHWKNNEFVDIVHDQPIWAWFTEDDL